MSEAVTIVITRRVREGSEADFERAVIDWIPKSIEFPGHQGVLVVQPPPGGREYGAVIRFESLKHWQNFQNAPEYRDFLQKIRGYLETEPKVETITGMEAWFRWNDQHPPPRWKMAAVTYLGVCITASALHFVVSPFMNDWAWFPRFMLMNAIVVVLLTWMVMPVLSTLMQAWLRPNKLVSKK